MFEGDKIIRSKFKYSDKSSFVVFIFLAGVSWCGAATVYNCAGQADQHSDLPCCGQLRCAGSPQYSVGKTSEHELRESQYCLVPALDLEDISEYLARTIEKM